MTQNVFFSLWRIRIDIKTKLWDHQIVINRSLISISLFPMNSLDAIASLASKSRTSKSLPQN